MMRGVWEIVWAEWVQWFSGGEGGGSFNFLFDFFFYFVLVF
jgi:hypothetical protein